MFILFVALGGAVGAMIRAWLMEFFPRNPDGIPLTVMSINIVGSLLIGIVVGYLQTKIEHASYMPHLKAFLMIGILGGFTTFSAFSLEALELIIAGNIMKACVYVTCSVFLSMLAVAIGYYSFSS